MRDYTQNDMISSLQEADYYYDSHLTVEDLMGKPSLHTDLVHYLSNVLRSLFREHSCAIYKNLNFYQTIDLNEYPIAPDIAVIKGVAYSHRRSWTVGITGPAPHIVFEIASEETWHIDSKEKPFKYARMGVQEYFLYDPETPPHLKHMGKKRRLIGWQRNNITGTMEELQPDHAGRLWSGQLDSFLLPDNLILRLLDRSYQLRFTEEGTYEQRRQLLEQKVLILEEKLRSLGVNPDEL